MSAIGGMVNWNAEAMDSRPIFEMSRTMMLRAGASRNAYVQKQVALVQNHARGDACRMPQILHREGRRCAAVVDGNPSFSSVGEELFEGFFEVDAPGTVLDAYLSFREGLGDSLSGPFALAVADELRAEIAKQSDKAVIDSLKAEMEKAYAEAERRTIEIIENNLNPMGGFLYMVAGRKIDSVSRQRLIDLQRDFGAGNHLTADQVVTDNFLCNCQSHWSHPFCALKEKSN